MKHRLIEILDAGTVMYAHITQFEKIDEEICAKIGIRTDYVILNIFHGSYVNTFAGYDFDKDYFNSKTINKDYKSTDKGIGLAIKSVNDIKYLPDPLNVEHARMLSIYIDHDSGIDINNIYQEINDYDHKDLRKVLYMPFNSPRFDIINIKTNEIVYWRFSTGKIKDMIPLYLWLPIKPITKNELKNSKYETLDVYCID